MMSATKARDAKVDQAPLVARMKIAKEASGMSQYQLADRLGVSRAMIQHLLRGSYSVSIQHVINWARACDVTTEWLMEDLEK